MLDMDTPKTRAVVISETVSVLAHEAIQVVTFIGESAVDFTRLSIKASAPIDATFSFMDHNKNVIDSYHLNGTAIDTVIDVKYGTPDKKLRFGLTCLNGEDACLDLVLVGSAQ